MHNTLWGSMGRSLFMAALALVLASCAAVSTDSADAVLKRADLAMGGNTLRSIAFAGSGSGATFGQAFEPGTAWPKITYSSFSRVADYENAAFREDAARSRAEPKGGGAVPLMGTGEQRTTGLARGNFAWNLAGTTVIPAAVALDGRIHDLWTTPHGVIKAAMANHATMSMRNDGGRSVTAVSFAVPGRFKATALINSDGLVEQIESVQPNPVLGDTPSVITFSEYQNVGGVQFPMRIRQSLGGFPVLDLAVKEVTPNAPSGIELPSMMQSAVERVTADQVAEGVWFIAGGSHNSVAIEMKDHMLLVESPLFDGRAIPVLAKVKELGKGKPTTMVINSHHHFDHAGGLRAAVAEGTTLVTSELARPYFERVFANPNSINPDAMQKSGRKPVLTGVSAKRVFTDGERVVEVHFIEASLHAQGFMMVYLPREKLLIEADAFTPGPPNTPPPARPNELSVNLVQNMERLNIQAEQILPLHGRLATVTELFQAAGR